jgi:hypothetical protein
MDENDPEGGLDYSALATTRARTMVAEPGGFGLYRGLTINTTLDPAVQPLLFDHKIDGVPVLPGVMGIEAFAEAALSILPGWQIEAIENVDFRAPFKFYRNQPRTFSVEVRFRADGDRIIAACELLGRRSLPGQAEPQLTTYFTAMVLLTPQAQKAASEAVPAAPSGVVLQAADIYRLYFHGPAYQVLERAWRQDQQVIGQMALGLPANSAPAMPMVLDPRLIELCFQTAGIWEMGEKSRMALPQQIGRIKWYGVPSAAPDTYYAILRSDNGNGFDAKVVDASGRLCLELIGYRTSELPDSIDAARLKPVKSAISEEAPSLAAAS